jgi:hypothetical protein
MWGPEAFSGLLAEEYSDSPDGVRSVAYFDKSRMEVNNPYGDPSEQWYVTNGLLARDLIFGQIQVGDDEFRYLSPPDINVAGDADDPSGPTYQTFHDVMSAPPLPEGSVITQTIDRSGHVQDDESLAEYGVTVSHLEAATGHTIASVFWEFMHSSGPISQDGEPAEGRLFMNPYFATGFPLTEPYWTTVRVDGEPRKVLIQVFERRVLTFTPGNPAGWAVEAGNVGQHYYDWKYDLLDDEPHQQAVLPAPATDEASCLDPLEREFLHLINEYRQEHGLLTLENSQTLNIASYYHSLDMGEQGYFAHESLDGRVPWDRMRDAGYDYNTLRAENLAAGQETAERVFQAWRDSPGHNANMLHPDVNAIGIARVEVPGSAFGIYWTTKFGGYVDAAPNCPDDNANAVS